MGLSEPKYSWTTKRNFLVEDTRNLAFAEPPSRLTWSFSFLLFLRPLLVGTDHLPWSSSFLLSHVPFLWRQTTFLGCLLFFFLTSPSCGDRPALAELDGFHVCDLVCSSSEKKSFTSLTWATRRTKKNSTANLVGSSSVLDFSLSCLTQLVGIKSSTAKSRSNLNTPLTSVKRLTACTERILEF